MRNSLILIMLLFMAHRRRPRRRPRIFSTAETSERKPAARAMPMSITQRRSSWMTNFAAAYFERGDLKMRNQRHQEAIADLTKAVELDPTLYKAYAERAFSYGGDRKIRRING